MAPGVFDMDVSDEIADSLVSIREGTITGEKSVPRVPVYRQPGMINRPNDLGSARSCVSPKPGFILQNQLQAGCMGCLGSTREDFKKLAGRVASRSAAAIEPKGHNSLHA